MVDSLWGNDFVIKPEQTVSKKILEKIRKSKDTKKSVESVLKSKVVDVKEKLRIIAENVKRILGRYDSQTTTIKTKEEYARYIDKAVENGIIAVDTETNNSLDTLHCKIMGLCLYTPGERACYIPVNHVNLDTGERLKWQLTEQDLAEQLVRLKDTKILMHNGKFDYQVIKNTCGVKLKIYWDSLIAAKLLDENEKSAGLKQQYIAKIDNTVEKYSIEHLFKGVEYAVVEPELFTLYAATDSLMTYKLYEWQYDKLSREENKKLLDLMLRVEMPVEEVAAEMELTGVEVDLEHAERLSKKYNKQLSKLQDKINAELLKLEPQIEEWRKTPEANYKSSKSDGELNKSKSEQLSTPVNVASPLQLAILLYDVLKVGVIDKKAPRGTGEDILKQIDLPICNLIVEYRGLAKLISTYIDAIPKLVDPATGRVHTHFNQYGAATGRFSSSDPINL